MVRIGIITTHRANNFGAVLQAYSLVMACRELGADAEIIDWRTPMYEWQYHSAVRLTRNPFAVLRHFLWYMRSESRARSMFAEFRKRLPLSKPIKRMADLIQYSEHYDKFIVGSDQVWNPKNSGLSAEQFDRAYLLNFAGGRMRYAYAASIGVDEIDPPKVRDEFVSAWKKFELITMREHAGAEYVSRWLGEKIDSVIDPVLLHDAQWWMGHVTIAPPAQKFVFEYNVRMVPELDDYAEAKANELDALLLRPLIPSYSHVSQTGCRAMGPEEFVSSIALAEAVVTSSFHAAAFSVIFGKPLYLILRTNSGDPNSRFSALFRFAGLKPKSVVVGGKYTIFFIDCGQTKYQDLVKERHRSIGLLKRMCCNINASAS